MTVHGYLLVVITSVLVEICDYPQKRYITDALTLNGRLAVACFQGLVFLLYPLLGHLADVYLNRYRTLKCGLITSIVGQGASIVLLLAGLALFFIMKSHSVDHGHAGALIFISAAAAVVGIGLIQANIIQFGLDQLLEAPTQKVIAFIQWYYWSKTFGQLVSFYIAAAVAAQDVCIIKTTLGDLDNTIMIAGIAITSLATVGALVLFCVSKKHFYIQRAVQSHSRYDIGYSIR